VGQRTSSVRPVRKRPVSAASAPKQIAPNGMPKRMHQVGLILRLRGRATQSACLSTNPQNPAAAFCSEKLFLKQHTICQSGFFFGFMIRRKFLGDTPP
jgi:hypothetical protein